MIQDVLPDATRFHSLQVLIGSCFFPPVVSSVFFSFGFYHHSLISWSVHCVVENSHRSNSCKEWNLFRPNVQALPISKRLITLFLLIVDTISFNVGIASAYSLTINNRSTLL